MEHRRWLDVDHDFRKEGMLFDGSNDTRSTPIPLVVLDIILDTEHLIGHCLGRKGQLAYNKKKKKGSRPEWLEEEDYIFHLALLRGSQVATQS